VETFEGARSLTNIGEIVARLVAAGTPPEVAAMAVCEAFQMGASTGQSADYPRDEATERRRAYDRERARTKREIRRQSADSADSPKSALTSLSLETDINKGKERKKERGEKISADWQPSDSHYLDGAELGFSRAEVDGFAEDIRLWARANEHRQVARKSNWDLAFSAWIRRASRDRKQRGPPKKSSFLDIALEIDRQQNEPSNDPPQIPVQRTGT
jgi:hypothetical protein